MTDRQTILFRCDASAQIGFGHLVRCLALADEIRRNGSVRACFAMHEGAIGSDVVRQHGYDVLWIPSAHGSYGPWLSESMHEVNARTVVVDVRDDLSRQGLESLHDRGCLVVLLDDLSDRRFAADLVFYPPVPQVLRADWTNFHGERFVGWEWTILRSQFASALHRQPPRGRSVLITMGGSDPAGITLQAVRAVELANADCSPVIVLGSGFQHRKALVELLATARRQFTIRENVSDMRTLMVQSDLALCSYGMTAFELAASGVPAIYLCLTDDHGESASALENAGAGRSLGVFNDVEDQRLATALTELLTDPARRAQMSDKAQELIDGQGAARIAKMLAHRLENSGECA